MKTFIASLCLLLAAVGCVSNAQKTLVDGPDAETEQPFPTEQEIQQDLYRRQHENDCSELQAKIRARQGADMIAGKPLEVVNKLTAGETPLAEKCGSTLVHPLHAVIKEAVGCHDTLGGDSHVFLSGPHDTYYELVIDVHEHAAGAAPIKLEMMRYYRVKFWEWEERGWGYYWDHILHVQDLGGC